MSCGTVCIRGSYESRWKNPPNPFNRARFCRDGMKISRPVFSCVLLTLNLKIYNAGICRQESVIQKSFDGLSLNPVKPLSVIGATQSPSSACVIVVTRK